MSCSTDRYGTEVLSGAEAESLNQPLRLPFSGKVIKNRFCKSALSENLARSDGQIDNAHLNKLLNVYDSWAQGGFGLIITGNVMVDRTMREMEFNVSVEDERDLGRLKVWAQTVQNHGGALFAQISHPGRQTHAHLTKEPVAPSAVPSPNFHRLMVFNYPRALTVPEIHQTIQRFITTSVVLHKAGFDGVQIHAAHGYLVSQFLNPRTNIRTDKYGGSIENRARFLCEIIQGIRQATPREFSIGVKLNSVDFGRRQSPKGQQQQWNQNTKDAALAAEIKDLDADDEQIERSLDDAVQVSLMLENLGVDFIEISGGSYESWVGGLLDRNEKRINIEQQKLSESTQKREAHFAVFADRISNKLKITKVILTGGFVSAKGMINALNSLSDEESIHSNGQPHIDMIGLGRPACHEPNLPNLIMAGSVTGAVRIPKMLGGFLDDVFVSTGNIHRIANQKEPVWNLSSILLSRNHIANVLLYSKMIWSGIKNSI
ncbi:hypothetical protein BX616_000254 [Lobosporangium transversale]|uniref:NADH:flavin oxidoreductase/NADH oxidase N-terminal domain-containing protein n=1 Tax=Lobosporangium transversale TaxID=64571 RepID=A0A1Y2H4S9_9FUNG|nr:hypothetical protein BCR41DRAFT_417859 [Lobosporangium transversale]KAF9917680.1 hypothetical protein BX616_000254 [Lobosporangium transversale]ORZ28723.1 hypothetical protein BCR41DRAFT_417859 [Lobosporangium transversale]|eukprot:XP_021886396.1 hypothetical protein BCR41DRAFT_417859 [Lobosporangium transversale]